MSVVYNDIILSNVKQNDQIYNQLLIIKGTIFNITQVTQLVISLNNDLVKYHEYFVDNKTYKFIVLVRLERTGDHSLEFRYGDSRLDLNVTRFESICKYTVVPLYIIFKGHSGNFQADNANLNTPQIGCKRLQLGLELIQSFYAEKLYENGYDKKTFSIEKSCDIFHSQLDVEEAYKLSENELWKYLAYEIVSKEKGDFKTKKYIGFLSFTHYTGINEFDYTYENIFKNTKGQIAISNGGLALLGTGCLYVWADYLDEVIENLKSNKTVDITKLLDDSNYRKTYGGCYSTTLGTLCHEIGHLFDLGHTEDGIMGNEVDFINRFFSLTNYTENLPNRILSSSNRPLVQAPCSSTKLTKIRKPGMFLDAYHKQKNNDLCYFTKNCLITLNYHKWFNSNDNLNASQLQFIHNERLIKSYHAPIRLIELRQSDFGMLIEYWSFLEKSIFEFQIPNNVESSGTTLLVIDDKGDLLNCDI